MEEYRQSQKEKWEKEKGPPHSQRIESIRSKSPSSKPKTPEKDKVERDKQHRPPPNPKQSTTPPTTPKAKTTSSNTKELLRSSQKTKIQQGESLIQEIVQSWHSSYLYSVKHIETQAEAEKYPNSISSIKMF
jgi:hypothetical protein